MLQILVVSDGFFDVPFEAMHRQVHAAELDGIGQALPAHVCLVHAMGRQNTLSHPHPRPFSQWEKGVG